MEKKPKMPTGFFLNIQMLYDRMEEKGITGSLIRASDHPCLIGMQFYYGQEGLSDKYIYLCTGEELEVHPFPLKNGFLVIIGEPERRENLFGCSYIIIPEGEDLYEAANQIQEIFVEYSLLEKKLNDILNNDGNLDDICVLAIEHFKNPVFIHDEYFNILSCPQFVEGATNFTYNVQTGKYMQDAETLNNFRTSHAYKKTLLTNGGQLWDSDFDDSRSIYANIRINNNYKGRFVIVETVFALKPGQLCETAYFAEIIKCILLRHCIEEAEEKNPLQNFIMDAVNGVQLDYGLLEKKISGLGWNREDRYVCGMILFENEEVTQLSIYVICNDIEEHVQGSYTCYFKNAIYLLINLSKRNLMLTELRMLMSYIIREGLLNIGVSNEFQDINKFPLYIRQAEVALRYGRKKKSTCWYHEFRDYALEYWLKEGVGEFTGETISSSAVYLLRTYDKKHGTALYSTLKNYLIYERNATLTSRILKIHRSTLPYRLERITQLTGLNLEDFKTRLYLLMSFHILDEGE